eukprot:1580782-Amphidinium_carterae.3
MALAISNQQRPQVQGHSQSEGANKRGGICPWYRVSSYRSTQEFVVKVEDEAMPHVNNEELFQQEATTPFALVDLVAEDAIEHRAKKQQGFESYRIVSPRLFGSELT